METPTEEAPPKEQKSRFIKDFSPIEQWDQVAASMIYKELAPKGLKTYTNARLRGVEYADIPYLSKAQIGNCQKIAAQLVRTYRAELKSQFEQRIAEVQKCENQAMENRDKTKFWQIGKRKELQREYEHYRDQGGLLTVVLGWIDQIKVPSK